MKTPSVQKIYVQPPTQSHGTGVLGVYLEPGQKVKWIYTYLSDGTKYASGYEIVKDEFDLAENLWRLKKRLKSQTATSSE